MTTATNLHEVRAWTLEYKDPAAGIRGSDKYYNVYAFADGTLLINYGRIGTNGQSKIEKHTPEEALILAQRQVFTKAGKGYKMLQEAFDFTITPEVQHAVVNGYGNHYLEMAMRDALRISEFTQKQRLVTSHYDTFIEQANKVLDEAAKGADFDSLVDKWKNLSESWGELAAKHEHAATAVGMVQQVVAQRMMAG